MVHYNLLSRSFHGSPLETEGLWDLAPFPFPSMDPWGFIPLSCFHKQVASHIISLLCWESSLLNIPLVGFSLEFLGLGVFLIKQWDGLNYVPIEFISHSILVLLIIFKWIWNPYSSSTLWQVLSPMYKMNYLSSHSIQVSLIHFSLELWRILVSDSSSWVKIFCSMMVNPLAIKDSFNASMMSKRMLEVT